MYVFITLLLKICSVRLVSHSSLTLVNCPWGFLHFLQQSYFPMWFSSTWFTSSCRLYADLELRDIQMVVLTFLKKQKKKPESRHWLFILFFCALFNFGQCFWWTGTDYRNNICNKMYVYVKTSFVFVLNTQTCHRHTFYVPKESGFWILDSHQKPQNHRIENSVIIFRGINSTWFVYSTVHVWYMCICVCAWICFLHSIYGHFPIICQDEEGKVHKKYKQEKYTCENTRILYFISYKCQFFSMWRISHVIPIIYAF